MVVDGDAISGGRLVIRAMEPGDLDAADRVMRVAFGTFVGATEPSEMFGDMEYVRPRFAAAPDWAFVAELDGEVVGSNFATRWGSFASFGPLSIRPDLWDRGIAVALMQPIVELFERWEVRQAGLHTFAQSAKHVGLYQRFDFWPQFLTAIMTKSIPRAVQDTEFLRFSEVAVETRDVVLTECAALTNAIFEGLDVRHEILSVDNQQLGDTVIVHDGHGVAGLAVCHCGAGEAGSASCYIKFAAARPGADAGGVFERILAVAERLAADRGISQLVAGVNTGRHHAYRKLLSRGYRAGGQGVRMHRPNSLGYCTPDVYVIDDLR